MQSIGSTRYGVTSFRQGPGILESSETRLCRAAHCETVNPWSGKAATMASETTLALGL